MAEDDRDEEEGFNAADGGDWYTQHCPTTHTVVAAQAGSGKTRWLLRVARAWMARHRHRSGRLVYDTDVACATVVIAEANIRHYPTPPVVVVVCFNRALCRETAGRVGDVAVKVHTVHGLASTVFGCPVRDNIVLMQAMDKVCAGDTAAVLVNNYLSRLELLCIDEVQDLDATMMRFLHWVATVGGGAGGADPVRLLAVGDPRQQIYNFMRSPADVAAVDLVFTSPAQVLGDPGALGWTLGAPPQDSSIARSARLSPELCRFLNTHFGAATCSAAGTAVFGDQHQQHYRQRTSPTKCRRTSSPSSSSSTSSNNAGMLDAPMASEVPILVLSSRRVHHGVIPTLLQWLLATTPVQPSDILVLVPSLRAAHVRSALGALLDQGFAVRTSSDRGLAEEYAARTGRDDGDGDSDAAAAVATAGEVLLSTFHQAKGLERPVVLVVGTGFVVRSALSEVPEGTTSAAAVHTNARALHVALTRPSRLLVFFLSKSDVLLPVDHLDQLPLTTRPVAFEQIEQAAARAAAAVAAAVELPGGTTRPSLHLRLMDPRLLGAWFTDDVGRARARAVEHKLWQQRQRAAPLASNDVVAFCPTALVRDVLGAVQVTTMFPGDDAGQGGGAAAALPCPDLSAYTDVGASQAHNAVRVVVLHTIVVMVAHTVIADAWQDAAGDTGALRALTERCHPYWVSGSQHALYMLRRNRGAALSDCWQTAVAAFQARHAERDATAAAGTAAVGVQAYASVARFDPHSLPPVGPSGGTRDWCAAVLVCMAASGGSETYGQDYVHRTVLVRMRDMAWCTDAVAAFVDRCVANIVAAYRLFAGASAAAGGVPHFDAGRISLESYTVGHIACCEKHGRTAVACGAMLCVAPSGSGGCCYTNVLTAFGDVTPEVVARAALTMAALQTPCVYVVCFPTGSVVRVAVSDDDDAAAATAFHAAVARMLAHKAACSDS